MTCHAQWRARLAVLALPGYRSLRHVKAQMLMHFVWLYSCKTMFDARGVLGACLWLSAFLLRPHLPIPRQLSQLR